MDSFRVKVDATMLVPVMLLALFVGGFYILPLLLLWFEKYMRYALNHLSTRTMEKVSKPEAFSIVARESDFPEDWWTSKELYALERRAIFSKTWLHVCHASLFNRPGDYRTFSIADFTVIMILGKDGVLRAFHNVCRHRAYNICDKSAGTSMALRCKYHGWTYDSRGKLVKAPKFDQVNGFNKSQNDLFEIRTFIDTSGFVYANFDVYGSDGLTIRVGMPIKARLNLRESWSMEAKFNWKFGLTAGAFQLQSLNNKRRLAQLFNSASAFVEYWTWPAEFELSPLTRMFRTGYGDLWFTVSILPIDHTTSTLSCALFSSRAEQDASKLAKALKQEMQGSIARLERSFLCVVKTGEVVNLETQEPLLAQIKAHSRLERIVRKEVHPASRLQESSEACKVADDLCQELETNASGADGRNPLDW